MKILVVEDNDDIRKTLIRYFEEEYFAVDSASNGETGSYLARTNEYDLILLDYLLPDKDGSEVCKEIRQSGCTVPILILSTLGDVTHKIKLLDLGADDYLSKPYSLQEIRARITALLRRPKMIVPNVVSFGLLVIDCLRHTVRYDTEIIYLTKKEFSLLEYLVRNAEMVVSRGMIMEHVWNMNTDPFSNTIEAHIFNLRKKIALSSPVLIHTVPGRGYKLSRG